MYEATNTPVIIRIDDFTFSNATYCNFVSYSISGASAAAGLVTLDQNKKEVSYDASVEQSLVFELKVHAQRGLKLSKPTIVFVHDCKTQELSLVKDGVEVYNVQVNKVGVSWKV